MGGTPSRRIGETRSHEIVLPTGATLPRHNGGVFVTFEGTDGAGKSSALAAVAAALDGAGHKVLVTREPGAGAFGAEIRRLLMAPEGLVPEAELFLFLADRAEHVARLVRPALARGEVVLCDRYADSTLVYQAFGRGLDEGFVRTANRLATGGLAPDLTLLLDLDVATAQSRLTKRDRFDDAGEAYHRVVREGFLRLAAEEPARWTILDAGRSLDAVAQDAIRAVLDRLAPG